MSNEERLLRHIRLGVFILAGCACLAVMIGFLILFWPEGYRWLIQRRTAVVVTAITLLVIAAPMILISLFFSLITRDPQ